MTVCPELETVASKAVRGVSVVTDPRKSPRYEMPSPVSRAVGWLDLTASHRTFFWMRSSLSPPVCIRSFTRSGCLVVFLWTGEMGSSSYFTYKRNGSRTDCSATDQQYQFSPSVPWKVFAHVLLGCYKPLLNVHRGPQQSGFTPADQPMPQSWPWGFLLSCIRSFSAPSLWHGSLECRLRLQGIGTPDTVLTLLRDLHSGTGARVKIGPETFHRFTTTSGVRHWCILALACFCHAIEWIIKNMSGLKSVTLVRCAVTALDYAYYIALPASQLLYLELCLSGFSAAARTMGLIVSWPKTKVQCFDPSGTLSNVIIEGNPMESVKSCSYHGSIQDPSDRCSPDILRRIGITASSIGSLSQIWRWERMSLRTILRVDMTCIF